MPKPFAIRLEQAKKFFFDAKAVESTVDRATRRALDRIGRFIRRTARRSMRHKRTKRAPAPPASRSKGNNLRFILYYYQPSDRSVIVGPVRFRTAQNVPRLMEHGGTARLARRSRRTGRITRRTLARYPRRPFMQPALEAEAPKLPDLLKEAVEREAQRRGRR